MGFAAKSLKCSLEWYWFCTGEKYSKASLGELPDSTAAARETWEKHCSGYCPGKGRKHREASAGELSLPPCLWQQEKRPWEGRAAPAMGWGTQGTCAREGRHLLQVWVRTILCQWDPQEHSSVGRIPAGADTHFSSQVHPLLPHTEGKCLGASSRTSEGERDGD